MRKFANNMRTEEIDIIPVVCHQQRHSGQLYYSPILEQYDVRLRDWRRAMDFMHVRTDGGHSVSVRRFDELKSVLKCLKCEVFEIPSLERLKEVEQCIWIVEEY